MPPPHEHLSDRPRPGPHRGGEGARPFACSLALAAAIAPGAAHAKCDIRVLEMPVKLVDQRAIVTIGLNGVQVPLIVDSGAFYSMLSESTETRLDLPRKRLPDGFQVSGVTGRIDVHMTTVAHVDFLAGQLSRVDFLVGGNAFGNGVQGLLGRNFLSLADTEYDLAQGMVRLVFPSRDCRDWNMAYWAQGAPVNVMPILDRFGDRNDTSIVVEAHVGGVRAEMLLDSGAPQTSIKRPTARRAGIRDEDMVPDARILGGGVGHARSWIATVPEIEIGDEKVLNNRIKVSDAEGSDEHGILGIDWFLSHRIYVARSQGKVYATWNGGPVFLRNQAAEGEAAGATPEADVPTDAAGFARRGEARALRKDPLHALEDLDRAVALAPAAAAHRVSRARVHLAMDQPALAARDLDEAVRLDPADTSARLLRAQVSARRGERDAALQDLQALDATLPRDAGMRRSVAAVYAEVDAAAQADHDWALWLDTHRDDAQGDSVRNERCWMRVRMNVELDRARRDCDAALDSDRDDASFVGTLAWLELREGHLEKARAGFDRSLALRPTSAWSLYGRGIVDRLSGRAGAAENDLAAARRVDPKIEEEARRHHMAADQLAPAVPAAEAGRRP